MMTAGTVLTTFYVQMPILPIEQVVARMMHTTCEQGRNASCAAHVEAGYAEQLWRLPAGLELSECLHGRERAAACCLRHQSSRAAAAAADVAYVDWLECVNALVLADMLLTQEPLTEAAAQKFFCIIRIRGWDSLHVD
jgi:hypothetical protein